MRSAVCVALFTSARLRSSAPFGNPVVPEVYWIMTASSGPTSGSSISGSAACPSSSTSSIAMISRNSLQFGAISSAIFRIGLPRWFVATMSPAERDWLSTYSTSLACNAGLTVTRMTPAIAHANSSTIHSGRFGAHNATRSPGSNRVVRARATASASRRSSRYVHWRRSSGSGRPAISATCSGTSLTASRSKSPMVRSRRSISVGPNACDGTDMSRQ